MGNLFLNNKTPRYPSSAFYRIVTPIFIDSDRIIYLDGDTLIFSDLNNMYNLDFNDCYILGIYDFNSDGVDYLGLKSNIYINTGVTLFNLKKMREDNKIIGFINITRRNINLKHVDQTVLNYVLYPKIGRLPSIYGIFNFADKSDMNIYLKRLRTKITIAELEEAIKNPVVIHTILCNPKVWFSKTIFMKKYTNCSKKNNCSCRKYFDLWNSFAKRTEYYEEVSKFPNIKI